MNILISLHKGYGLGDAVQVSAVLRHVVKYRPAWKIDYRSEEGRHQVGRGIVASTFAFGEQNPSDHYDAEVEILLFDTWANWGDRPNTRVSSCLHERFGLDWDAECGRYRVNVSDSAVKAAKALLTNGAGRQVAIHYRGDSSPDKKNLSHKQAEEICGHVDRLGYVPVILDWRRSCQIRECLKISTPQDWGGNAEMVCAVISQCRAFVGIDSGPSKCASATNTPSLVVWTRHHPAPFHDPSPNTTHLVPDGYHGLEPVCNDRGVIDWFESHYNVRQYDNDPVTQVKKWLSKTLTS